MAQSPIEAFEAMLASGRDDALLRFSLGNQYMKNGDAAAAAAHLRAAVVHDPHYSAAYKLLGKALESLERVDEALDAYRAGIAAAQARGDVQAAKEMNVFARRLSPQE